MDLRWVLFFFTCNFCLYLLLPHVTVDSRSHSLRSPHVTVDSYSHYGRLALRSTHTHTRAGHLTHTRTWSPHSHLHSVTLLALWSPRTRTHAGHLAFALALVAWHSSRFTCSYLLHHGCLRTFIALRLLLGIYYSRAHVLILTYYGRCTL